MKRIGTLFGIICTVLLTVHLSFGQTAKNLTQLGTQNDVIRNETTPGANTRGRIADMYKSIFLSSPNIFESYTDPSWLTLTFPGISGKPTTIGGYGITDFNSLGDARWLQSSTLGTGVSTWLTTPSWANFNSAITGTAPFIKTGGTSLLTSNVNMSRVTLFNSGNERDSSMLRINKSSSLLKHYWRDVNATGLGDREASISISKVDSTIWSTGSYFEIKLNSTLPALSRNMGMIIDPNAIRLGTNGGSGSGLRLNYNGFGLENSLVAPGGAAGFYSGNTEVYLANSFTSKMFGFDATGSYINLGSDATGDIHYRNSGGYLTRAAIGTAGQVMTVSGGIPTWATPGSGGTVTNVSSANANATVATQTTTPVITIVNSPAVGGITITGTPSVGQTPIATSGTAATWQTPASGFADPMTTRGDLIFRNASNTTARLAIGTAGQVPTSNGTDISWATPSGSGDMILANAQTNTGIKTFATGSLISPTITGGTAIGSGITYKSTTGAGTPTGIAHQFTGGTDGATVVMTMLNNGGVGIGTNTITNNSFGIPDALLVRSSGSNAGTIAATRNANTAGFGTGFIIGLNNSAGTRTDYAYFNGLIESNTAGAESGTLAFFTITSGTLSEKMRLTSAGSLGIGTATPTAATTLDVRGISGGSIHRLASNTNAERFDFLTNGGVEIGGSVGTSGQVITSAGAGSPVTWTSPSAATLTTPRTIGITTGDVTSAGSSFDGSANNTNALTIANDAVTTAKIINGAVTVDKMATILFKTVAAGTYTILEADKGYQITFTSTCTITLPNGLTTGHYFTVWNKSGGTLTFTATTTLNASGSTITSDNIGAYFQHIGSNIWEGAGAFGSGGVTNVSSANANATVATQTTTPVITIVNSPAVGGITITGTPSVGQSPIATSGTAATWQSPSIIKTSTNSTTETLITNYGALASSGTGTFSIRTNAHYSNNTVLIADITVFGIKSDGTTSVLGKVTGRYRKNNSGTFSVDDAGTAVISDTAILASIVPEINSTNPQILITMAGASGTYNMTVTAILNYVNY